MSGKSESNSKMDEDTSASSPSSSEESNSQLANEPKPKEEQVEMSDESSSSISRITSAIVPREEFRSDLPALRALLNSPPSLPQSERGASSLSEYSTTSTNKDYEETLSSAEAAAQKKELSFANRIQNFQDNAPGPSSGSRHNQPQNFTNVCSKIPKKITQRRDQTEFETGGNGHSRDSMEDEGISSDDSVNVIFEPFKSERGMQTVEPFTPSDTSSNGRRSPRKTTCDTRLNPSGPSTLQFSRSANSPNEPGKGAFVPVTKRGDAAGEDEEGNASSASSCPPSPTLASLAKNPPPPPCSPPPISPPTCTSPPSSPPPSSPPPISPPPHPEEANQEMLQISPNTMADRRRKLSPPEGPSTVGKRTKKEEEERIDEDVESEQFEETEVSVSGTYMIVVDESSSCASSESRNKETDDSLRPEVGSCHRDSELDSDIEDLPDEGREDSDD